MKNYTNENVRTFDENKRIAARCSNGSCLGKEDVIEYLQKVVDVQAKREECRRICERLNEEYQESQLVPDMPVRRKANVRIKRAIIFGLIAEFILLCPNQSELLRTLEAWVPWIAILLFIVLPIIKSVREYNQEVRYRNAEIERAARDKVILQSEYNSIRQLENQCDRTLASLYSPGILKPKYQTLPACTYILESLQNGLTHTLERTPDSSDPGAYGMFEELLRHNAVVDRLDDISGKIDDLSNIIIQNQRMLNEKLTQINRNVESAVSELSQIRNYSAFTAMNSATIAQNTAAIRENTAMTAFYSRCTALNTSRTFSSQLRTRTGLEF